jgi:hypothetical protein
VRIEPASKLETSGIALPLPNRIAMLPSPFFDPSVRHSLDVPLVFDTQPDRNSLKAAGIVSSWYGALAGYRGSHFRVSMGYIPKGNDILLSTSDGALATSLGLTAGKPLIAMCDNPSDRYGKILAIVAETTSDLVRVSQFLARNRFEEDGDRIILGPEQLSENITSAQGPQWSDTQHPIRITKDLNDSLLHARIGSPTRLYFRIAPDLDYGTKATVPLHLGFRLSGLSMDDHVWLSIRLNNTFVTSRRFSREDCSLPLNESFALPVSLLYPSNTLEIQLGRNRSDRSPLSASDSFC